ncbi:hypothetical protein AVEN_17593-1 [Araneus ventricosus]|uniref:Uncharacterized protein n=1 Tax=Araneus ventricosus TaxID=182803 RepID=A0A4Y2HW17_ARAVE|nr:hypothetical protein AVEN_17593-1 [Araneus ventricosus]
MWVEAVASAMFRVWLCLVPVLLTVAPGPAAPTGPSGSEKINITEILNSFFDKGYDKRVRPNYGGKFCYNRLSLQKKLLICS